MIIKQWTEKPILDSQHSKVQAAEKADAYDKQGTNFYND